LLKRWRRLGRPVRALLAGVVLLGALFLGLVAAGAVDNLVNRDHSLRNVSVAGVDVGGRSPDDLRDAIRALAPTLDDLPVRLVGNERTIDTDATDAGLTIDVEATAAAAYAEGRGRWAAVRWVAGLVRRREVPLQLRADKATLTTALAPFGTPRDDSVVFSVRNGALTVNDGRAGIAADVDQVGQALVASAAAGERPVRASVNTTFVEPGVSAAERRQLVDSANRVTASGISLKLGETAKNVDAVTLRGWLRPTPDGRDYRVDDDAVRKAVPPLFPGAGGPGRDAKFAVIDGAVQILEGEPATACCAADTGMRLTTALHARVTPVELAFAETPRPRGREWAATLGIKEVVGEFTTNYARGQPRVINIKRISELTQGVLIEPGKTFSINTFVGKRTIENGFVAGGVIQDGVFQEDVGGGISQYATTLFNAAFFGGLDFSKYQSHSIYISRYPYGREATVSYPSPDLEIKNTTPYAVLLWPTATDTSITVQLWSTKFATGAQTGQTEKPAGTACTRVTTERTRTYVDGRPPKVDTVSATYQREGIDCNGNPTPGATTTTTTTLPPPPPPPPTTAPPAPPPTEAPAPTTTAPTPPPPPTGAP
jgi:vancomycin resistance protein YoaR